MSRLEAVAKGLYYPTPDVVVRMVTTHLHPPKNLGSRQVLRVLDPCCGTGAQAGYIADSLGADSFGVELNGERARDAQSNLGRVLHTTAFGLKMTHGSFGCLFLNPPYDDDPEKKRLEHSFLVTLSRALCRDGVLVYIVPQQRLELSARYFALNYTNLSIFRFPDPEFDVFKQVVVFGTKKGSPSHNLEVERMVTAWSKAESLPVLEDSEIPTYVVPAHNQGEILFAPDIYDPDLAITEARRVGAWARPDFVDQVRPVEQPMVRPLMPFRFGHLAMEIAAGLLNDLVIQSGNTRMLVKGTMRKIMVDKTTKDDRHDGTTREREELETSCVVLRLDTWDIETIGVKETPAQGADTPESNSEGE